MKRSSAEFVRLGHQVHEPTTRGNAVWRVDLQPADMPDGDYTGYDFWLTKLNQFNGNFAAAEMVKAFIESIEYRQRFGQV